ncbi:MAG: hypothetical protein ABDH21_01290 [bacterium]
MIFTLKQIQELVEKVGNEKATKIFMNYFYSIRDHLDSSDVSFIYDDDYFRMISNHPVALKIGDIVKINIYQYPSYEYLKNIVTGKKFYQSDVV